MFLTLGRLCMLVLIDKISQFNQINSIDCRSRSSFPPVLRPIADARRTHTKNYLCRSYYRLFNYLSSSLNTFGVYEITLYEITHLLSKFVWNAGGRPCGLAAGDYTIALGQSPLEPVANIVATFIPFVTVLLTKIRNRLHFSFIGKLMFFFQAEKLACNKLRRWFCCWRPHWSRPHRFEVASHLFSEENFSWDLSLVS